MEEVRQACRNGLLTFLPRCPRPASAHSIYGVQVHKSAMRHWAAQLVGPVCAQQGCLLAGLAQLRCLCLFSLSACNNLDCSLCNGASNAASCSVCCPCRCKHVAITQESHARHAPLPAASPPTQMKTCTKCAPLASGPLQV